jgi:hypothetical protein
MLTAFVYSSREHTTYIFVFHLFGSRKKLAILMIFTSGMSKANGMFRVFASFWQEETYKAAILVLNRRITCPLRF